MKLNCFTYKKETFTCKYCNWTGKGDELSFGKFSEKFSLVDENCPKCFELIYSWIAPTREEIKEWKVNNNNKPTDWDNLI